MMTSMSHSECSAREEAGVALLEETIARTGRIRLRVFGSSMLPAIWPGDLIVADRRPLDQLRAGDVVVIKRGERVFVHRVIAVPGRGQELFTRGDCLPYPDPATAAGQILGTVVRIRRGGQEWTPSRRLSFHERLLARLLSAGGWTSSLAHRLHGRWRQACTFAVNGKSSILVSET